MRYLLSGLYPQIILRENFNFLKSKFLVPLSGMVETPRLQAKQVLRCRGATCHPELVSESNKINML
jgi:hypothetical protein